MSPSVLGCVCCAALAAAFLMPAASGAWPVRDHARPATSAPSGARLRVLAAIAVGAATAVLLGQTVGLLLAPVAAVVTWRWMGSVESRRSRRRREALDRGLPLAVDLIAACLAVGASPAGALAEVAAAVEPPMSEELAAVATRLRLGADPAGVWEDLARHPQLGPMGRALARAVRAGASVADAMTRLAEDLRSAARSQVEGRARAVAVKAAAPLGLCLLPAFVLVGVVPLVAGAVSAFLTR